MANYYSDHPEIAFHLDHPLMKRIVELKERNYADAATYADAPINRIADYVINGTVEEVVPKLIKYYKQNSK